MTYKQIILGALITFAISADRSAAQGMPVDSLATRFRTELGVSDATSQLRAFIPNYDQLRVWGMAVGDFSNDAAADLAISLYDLKGPKQQVKVYLFQNQSGRLVPMLTKTAAYFESPIEVGLSIDNSAVSIIQKTGETSWFQEGFTIQFGDVILTDRYDTESQSVQAVKGQTPRNFGRQVSRNFENLMTREMYFGGASGETLLSTEYYTIPAYNRLRSIYPGYGSWMMDTSMNFILEGVTHRRNFMDHSIANGVAAYDDDFLYISLSINDDYLAGGNAKLEANDRVVIWLDTYLKGDRLIKSRKGGSLTFRNALDSFIYSLTIPLSHLPGNIEKISHTSVAPLTSEQREAAQFVKAQYSHDTIGSALTGYTLKVRIPWGFLGFEMNPVSLYETRAPQVAGRAESTEKEESPVFGFTAIVHDIDDPSRPLEKTVQATSRFRLGDPSSFGALDLKPTTQFYGRVYSTYLGSLKGGLVEAGF